MGQRTLIVTCVLFLLGLGTLGVVTLVQDILARCDCQDDEKEAYDGPMHEEEDSFSLMPGECYLIRVTDACSWTREDDTICLGGSISFIFEGVEDVAVTHMPSSGPTTLVAEFYNGSATYMLDAAHPHRIYSMDVKPDYTLIIFGNEDPGVDYEMPPVGGDPS